jgi:hypothetical protein
MKMKKFCFAKRAIEIVEKRTKSAQKIIKDVIVTLTLAVPLMCCFSCNSAADEEEYTGTKIRIIYTDRITIESEEAPQILDKDLMTRLNIDPARVEKVFIPTSVSQIENHSLKNFKELTKVILGNESRLESIGEQAFFCCEKLDGFPFEKALYLQIIGKYAFSECKELTSIKIPTAVYKIKKGAFLKCGKLATVTFARDGVIQKLGSIVFSDCRALREVVLPLQLRVIKWGAFQETGLESIILPPNLQEIGSDAFMHTELTSLSIPASVRLFNSKAFFGLHLLKNIRLTSFQDWDESLFINVPDGCVVTFADKNFALRLTEAADWERITPLFSLPNICLASASAILLGVIAFVFWRKVLSPRVLRQS